MPTHLSSTAIAGLLLLTSPLSAAPAFPGATGAGKNATGGRPTSAVPRPFICRVTSLADSGAGTLRDCLTRTGPRYVVLRVGGTIVLQSQIIVRTGSVSLLGRRAPGPVQIRMNTASTNCRTPLVFKGISNVVVRDVRIRPGKCPDIKRSGTDALLFENATNFMVDHVSLAWGMDENFDSFGAVNNYTVSNSIMAEGLQPHSKGSLDCSKTLNGTCVGTHYRNLFASNNDRNPEASGGVNSRLDVIDTVVYNPGSGCVEIKETTDGNLPVLPSLNYLGNTCIKGNNTASIMTQVLWEKIHEHPGDVKIYAPEAQNAREGIATYARPGTPFVSAPIGTLTATPSTPSTALAGVLNDAGARPRDTMDARIIDYVRNRKGGRIITNPTEVGGYPIMDFVAAQADSDGDGLPNTFETQHGAMTPESDLDADGYPAIEEFENGTSPRVKN